LFLVLWGFIRLPLILPCFSAELPSILVLKNQLLRAFLRHLAFSNLSQNFLPDPKPLRIYSSGILAIGKIPLAFPLSLPGKNHPFDFLIKHQHLSVMTFLILALISSIPKDWRNQCLVLFCLPHEPPKRGILAYA